MRVAFGCQARVGKDTSADHLIATRGGKKLSFAKPLYDILSYAQGRLGFELEKDREFLLFVGNWARAKRATVFLDEMRSRAECDEHLYVTDVRFLNELEMLKRTGWTTIKISRPDRDLGADEQFRNDISETALMDPKYDALWDYTIINDGTLDELKARLDALNLK
jgi:hypothetical protein